MSSSLFGASIGRLMRVPAAIIGALALALGTAQAAWLLGSTLGHTGEPFRTIPHYLWSDFALGMLLAPPVVVVCAMVALVLAILCRIQWGVIARLLRAILLGLVLASPFTAAWGAAHAISHVPRTTFGLTQGKPAWPSSPLFTILGSTWLLIPIGVLMIATVVRAEREIRRREDAMLGLTCATCGYMLCGSRSAQCPECGREVPAPQNRVNRTMRA